MKTSINFTSNLRTLQAEYFRSDTATLNGAIIIISYGTEGMNEPWGSHIRKYATTLSSRGFIALIPDYFSSTDTKAGFQVLEAIATHRSTWQQAIDDAITHAKSLSGVDASRIGLLGFSLGGHLSLRLRDKAKVLVEYFAPEFDSIGTSSNSSLLVQIHHGLADQIVPYSPNADNIEKQLLAEGVKVDIFSYPNANHGFIGDDVDNQAAREDSMARTISHFEKYL